MWTVLGEEHVTTPQGSVHVLKAVLVQIVENFPHLIAEGISSYSTGRGVVFVCCVVSFVNNHSSVRTPPAEAAMAVKQRRSESFKLECQQGDDSEYGYNSFVKNSSFHRVESLGCSQCPGSCVSEQRYSTEI
jgi:hypothetical protein